MKYFFQRTDGTRIELIEQQCYDQIERNTGLDSTMIGICLNGEGIKHPFGTWVKVQLIAK